jgi:hypothetical protein
MFEKIKNESKRRIIEIFKELFLNSMNQHNEQIMDQLYEDGDRNNKLNKKY